MESSVLTSSEIRLHISLPCLELQLRKLRKVLRESFGYFEEISKTTRASARLELNSLQQGVKNSLSDVQRYLSLGWIGVWEVLHGKNLDMNDLMDLWQDFYSFLLRLQQIFLKLEKILTFWEKVLYLLLLFSSFSEFPNSLRPPCTTMPWTIWPALVVLWGVCWMFYERVNSNWEESAGLFEDKNFGGQSPDFDFIIRNYDFNAPDWRTPHFDYLSLEQQMQQSIPEPATTFRTPIPIGFVPTSLTVNPRDTVSLPVITDEIPGTIVGATSGTPRRATSATQEAAEERLLEAFNIPSPVHEQPLCGARSTTTDCRQTKPSRNSKHGQNERYLCPYSDCSHSQVGSGFSRKDHLDQHLRGPHKQRSVARVRAKPAAPSSSHNPTATTQIVQALSQSKKRKRRGDGESDMHSVDELADELAEELVEERRLRLLAEQENERLCQKLEKYEERMEKYEERLDRMMTLFGEHKGKGTEK